MQQCVLLKGSMYWEMMRLPVLLTAFFGVTCAAGAEGHGEPPGSTCEMYTDVPLAVTEGEALRVVPDGVRGVTWNESQHHLFTWRREPENASFSSAEDQRIHHHGPALFFLPLSVNDSGLYVARLNFFGGKCHIFHVPLLVMPASAPLGEHRLYTPMEASGPNPFVTCPEQVADLCKEFNGVLSWYRNSCLIPQENRPELQLRGPALAHVGMYTCNCTWGHRGNDFYSTASRELQIMGQNPKTPQRCEKLEIIQPTTTGRERARDILFLNLHSGSRTVQVVVLLCVSIVFLLAVSLAIKLFAVDLALFFRRFWRCTKAANNGSQYDVYVVHRSQPESKGTLNQFLSQALPLVLEQQCGYRVFIQGRDDILREDGLEQVREKVRLSRRLMVVFSPGPDTSQTPGSSPNSPAGADVDWQVGLQQALAQDTRLILVQLGEVGPQGYNHLSPSLQQLVHKCVPLCWLEDSPGAACWKSRFWKRVRYAMPILSTKPSSSSSFSVL